MPRRFSTFAVLIVLLAVCCGEGREPAAPAPAAEFTPETASPQATIAEILKVAESGDWAAYVDRFYGEKDKFTSPADSAQVVSQFATTWGPRVVEALKDAVGVDPRIENGKALFEKDGKMLYVLHQEADGTWKFHL